MSKSKKEEKPSCPICATHFTSVVRKPIVCAFCPQSVCRQCISQFLLTTQNDPHCMECKREWNREFIDTHLTQTFRKGPLKIHRRKVLMDRERGRLPAMQVFVEAHTIIKANTDKVSQLRIQRRQLKKQRNEIQVQSAGKGWDALAQDLEPILKELLEKKLEIRKLQEELFRAQSILTGKEKAEVKQFIMKCPAEDCRGFLSSAWKCGTCQKFFCADCHAEKAGMRDETHVCNEDAKATAAMIQQETKPCPKCGIRISKIDGCFAKDTPILLWDGRYKNSQDIKVGDILIGDDGQPRTVEELCSGGDEMFEVTQTKGMSYIVNSKHKLALKFSGEKNIYWSETEQAWKVRWFDRDELTMKTKKSRVDETISKEEAYFTMKTFCELLDFDEVIEITIDDFMKLSDSTKKHMMGFKSSACVSWPEKQLPLYPYLLGLWLGDGINDGMSFAINPEADPEILEYILKWCEENKAELIHDETYRFRIRRREVAKGRLAIGRGATSSECKGCKEKRCSLCDIPEKPYTEEVQVGLRHPLKEQLDKYDIPRKAKYIPTDYLTSNREARLQLLAGMIDTDGFVGNDGKRIHIPQANHNLGKQIEYLARSLGFAVHTDILKKTRISFPNYREKDYPDQYRVNISGEHLSEIPTRVPRKRCVDSNSTKDELRTGITVKSVGQGTYYGWMVSGTNKRFLLADFTVARNCDQMWCTGCHTTFSWNSGKILLNTVVHNPHYYEYLRKTNGGVVPREAGDVPCGGLPNHYLFIRTILDIQNYSEEKKRHIIDISRGIADIYDRLAQYPLRQNANVNRDIDISYLMNHLTEDEWGSKLEQAETKFERKKEIGLMLQTLVHVGAEKLTMVQNTVISQRPSAIDRAINELSELRDYINKSLLQKGIQMGMVVPQIGDLFRYGWSSRYQMKEAKKQNIIVHPSQPQDGTETEPELEDKETLLQEEAPEKNTVMVEIDGEFVEMNINVVKELQAQMV